MRKHPLPWALALGSLCLLVTHFGLRFIQSVGDDVYESAEGRFERKWTVDGAPTININTFDGAISVHPSKVGEVSLIVERHSTCKNGSVSMAKEAISAIEIIAAQDGDEIRVQAKVNGVLPSLCFLHTSTHLYAPRGSRLVLQTSGSTWVGGAPSEVVIRNDIRGAVSADFEVGPSSSTVTLSETDAVFAVADGAVFLNGRTCCKVGVRDRVRLTQSGKLYVNDLLLLP
jgi:hypothetical protein